MFFYLGDNCELLNNQKQGLFTDLGWNCHNDVYYKGYCLDYNIHTNIEKILGGDKPQGIYCLINDNKLIHSDMRPFPLYQQGETLTNLKIEGFNELVNSTRYVLPTIQNTLEQVVKNITDIVIENLTKINLDIWCTGGIDSMMLVALAEYAELPYTIHIAKPKKIFTNVMDYEATVQEYNSKLIDFCRKTYWAYSFMSVFQNKTITTGFYGDEYFCRSIWQLNVLANSIGKTGKEIVKASEYEFYHINAPIHSKFQLVDHRINLSNVKFTLLNLIGKSQVWHIDNTMTYCPLMDKRIAQNVWSLDVNDFFNVCPNAIIQKEIIKNTTPDVLLLVDRFKNTLHGRRNFFQNYDKVKLKNCKSLVVY